MNLYVLLFWAVSLSAGVDLFVYMGDFLYYESRPPGLLFLAVQAAVAALCVLLIRSAARKRQ